MIHVSATITDYQTQSRTRGRPMKFPLFALSFITAAFPSLPPKPKIIHGVRWWIWAMKSSIAVSTVLNSARPVSAAAAIRASKIIRISHLRRRASARKTRAHLLMFHYRSQRNNVIRRHGRPHRGLRGLERGTAERRRLRFPSARGANFSCCGAS